MKNIFLAVILGVTAFAGTAVAETVVQPMTPTPASAVVYLQPAPVAPSPAGFLLWPAVSFRFGFRHPYVSGYYHGYYGNLQKPAMKN